MIFIKSSNKRLLFFTIQHEIETLNNVNFKTNANWLQMLTQLIEDIQDYQCEAAHICLEKWQKERDLLR